MSGKKRKRTKLPNLSIPEGLSPSAAHQVREINHMLLFNDGTPRSELLKQRASVIRADLEGGTVAPPEGQVTEPPESPVAAHTEPTAKASQTLNPPSQSDQPEHKPSNLESNKLFEYFQVALVGAAFIGIIAMVVLAFSSLVSACDDAFSYSEDECIELLETSGDRSEPQDNREQAANEWTYNCLEY